MSVSDESGGKPAGAKRDWLALRYEYETTKISQRKLARKHGIPDNTVMQRAIREKWSQRAKLVRATAAKLDAELGEKAIAHVRDELAPLIEAEKVKITKRGIKVGNRGLTRIERLWRSKTPDDAKAEADGARAAETFLRMARVSLGMNDGTPAAGALNVNILTNQAAVQVTT